MKRKIIYCLMETVEISSDSDTSISSNVSELSNSSTECNWTDALYFPLIRYLISGAKRTKVEITWQLWNLEQIQNSKNTYDYQGQLIN